MRPSPLLVVAVGAALVMAACGSDAKPDQGGADRYGGPNGTTTTTSSSAATSETSTKTAGGTTTKPRGGTATTDPTTRPGGGGGGSNTGGGGATSTTGLKPLPTTVPGDDGSKGPPGAFARTLLRPQPATTIVFERFEQQGASPRQASLAHATSVLGDVTGKPVDTEGPIVVAGGAKEWTAEQLRTTADSLTTAGQGNGKAVLHVLFLRGNFEGNKEVLGVTVRGDVLALFTDIIASSATPLVPRAELEDAVLVHEIGHALGLVDLARNTGRADPEHPNHSKNTNSVMYWAVESSLVGQVLTGPPPRDFDSEDLADLRALRNGA